MLNEGLMKSVIALQFTITIEKKLANHFKMKHVNHNISFVWYIEANDSVVGRIS
jgi:hypothetical protein